MILKTNQPKYSPLATHFIMKLVLGVLKVTFILTINETSGTE